MEESNADALDPWFCWVQCDRCQQWRKLPGCTLEEYERIQDSKMWTCDMNRWNESQARCSDESNGSNVEVPEVKPSREIICYNVERLDPSQHALSESSEIPIFSYTKTPKTTKAENSFFYQFRSESNVRRLAPRCYAVSRRKSRRSATVSDIVADVTFRKKERGRSQRKKFGFKEKNKRLSSVQYKKNGLISGSASDSCAMHSKVMLSQGSEKQGQADDISQKKRLCAEIQEPQTLKVEEPGSVRWAQCDFCQKWRCLPGCSEKEYMELHQSNAPWHCSYNHWDISRADCSAPEEKFNFVAKDTSGSMFTEFDQEIDKQLGENNPLRGFAWHSLPFLVLQKLFNINWEQDTGKLEDLSTDSKHPLHRCHELLVDYFLSKDSVLVQSLQRLALFCFNEFRSRSSSQRSHASQEEKCCPVTVSDREQDHEENGAISKSSSQVLFDFLFFNCLQLGTPPKHEEDWNHHQGWLQLCGTFSSLIESSVPSCSSIFQFLRIFRPMLESLLDPTPRDGNRFSFVSFLHAIQRPDLVNLLMESNSEELDLLFQSPKEIPAIVLYKLPALSPLHPLYGRVLIQSDDARIEASLVFPKLLSLSCKNSSPCPLPGKTCTMLAHHASNEKAALLKTQESPKQVIHIDLPSRLPWPGVLESSTDSYSTIDLSTEDKSESSSYDTLLSKTSKNCEKLSSSLRVFFTLWNSSHKHSPKNLYEEELKRISKDLLSPFQETQNVQPSHSDFQECNPNSEQRAKLNAHQYEEFIKQWMTYHRLQLSPSDKVSCSSQSEWSKRKKGAKTLNALPAINDSYVSIVNGPNFRSKSFFSLAQKNTLFLRRLKELETAWADQLKRTSLDHEVNLNKNKLLTFSSLGQLRETDPLLDLCLILIHLQKLIVFTHWGSQFFQKVISSPESSIEKH